MLKIVLYHTSDENGNHNHDMFHFERIYSQKLSGLTKGEYRYCAALRINSTQKETAKALSIELSTAQTHCKNIKRKIGITGCGELYSYLVALGE